MGKTEIVKAKQKVKRRCVRCRLFRPVSSNIAAADVATKRFGFQTNTASAEPPNKVDQNFEC